MLDINKYLEDQKKMKLSAENRKRLKDEERSKEVKEMKESLLDEEEDLHSDEEYVPPIGSIGPSKSKNDSSHYDDGQVSLYRERIKTWKADEHFHEIEGNLRVPVSIWSRLYRYQRTGVKWLWELHRIGESADGGGGLLGDEMGLGKTVQLIALFAGLASSPPGLGASLVVAPASVIHQWVAHFHRWWPPLRVAVLHQSGSHGGDPAALLRSVHDDRGVLVVTYAGLVRHAPRLERRRWDYVALDEGHKIRNADTQIARAVKRLRARHRIVMTGSPLQNCLQELWSLFDFMTPGLLGTREAFTDQFAVPITQGGYANASAHQEALALSLATALKDAISPYMLRRTKDQVRDHINLPEKNEQVLFCSLTPEQKALYSGYLAGETVRGILDKKSFGPDPLRARIFVALATLRKICNHPDLYIHEVGEDENPADRRTFGHWRRAGKMIVIGSLLKIWKRQGHRALIFTQSRAMMCILEQFLQRSGHKYLKMDGSTGVGARQPLIAQFNEDDSHLVFLATTRVGGLGVNLTGADRVIIYDPDWNPATDGQAKERAWRIGQLRDVTVYRLLSAGTIEEKIYQRQVFKQLLSNKVLLNPNQKNYLKTSTLEGLFSLEEPDAAGSTETSNIFKHTKVGPRERPEKEKEKDSVLLSGGVSFSADKMAAMRRLAQQISKKLSDEPKVEAEDPRERYKRKLMPPPAPPEPDPVNVVDDQETDADFSTILNEIDIVTMYSKPTKLNALETFQVEVEDGEIPDENVEMKDHNEDAKETKTPIETETPPTVTTKISSSSKKRKRKQDKESPVEKIDYLESVKTLKEKRKKIDPYEAQNQDDYVLEKLFAKSGVKSALQHEKVIGLAEREERHRLRTETQAQALKALKALRKSRIKNWRW